MNKLTKLRIRYSIIAIYIIVIWLLCMACLINLSKLTEADNRLCQLDDGIRIITHISIWSSVIIWLVIANIHYSSYPVFKRLINNAVTDDDYSVIKNHMYYMYGNVLIGIISSINLSKIYINDSWRGCDSHQINMLTAIHSLNIFAASYIPAMYVLKVTYAIIGVVFLFIRGFLAWIKRNMFNLYLPDNMVFRSENGHHVLVDINTQAEPIGPSVPATEAPIMTGGNGSCPICMSDTKLVMAKLSCKHEMCIECCQEWLSRHTTCPFCRGELSSSTQQPEQQQSEPVVAVPADPILV